LASSLVVQSEKGSLRGSLFGVPEIAQGNPNQPLPKVQC